MSRLMRALAIAAVLVAMAHGSALALPDFEITSVTLTPSAPTAAGAYRADIVVTNVGTSSGDAGALAYNVNYVFYKTGLACMNPLLKPPAGWSVAAVGTLCGGTLCKFGTKSKKITLNLTAGSAGTKTFAAVADATCKTTETSETNNYKSLRYTVQAAAGPDFVVQSIALDPPAPSEGGTFTATVTVRNQGTVAAGGVLVDVWSDWAAAAAPVCNQDFGEASQLVEGDVQPGATATVTFPDLVAGAGGDKTFRAYVDSQCGVEEPNETNNQSVLSYTVGGGAPPTGTDFVIQSIVLDPPSPPEYGTFTATVTVKNQGTVAGDGGFLDVWTHWPDAPFPVCMDAGEAQLAVGDVLQPGATATLTFTDLIAGELGPKTFRAFVDSQCGATEPDEDNNQAVLSYAVGGGGGGGGPASFAKLSPAAGVTEQPVAVTLVWEASGGAESYEYCLDTRNDNECEGGNWVSTGAERVALVPGLSGSTRYYWQVRAINMSGLVEADEGAWWSFATQKSVPVFKDAFGHGAKLQDPDWAMLSGLWILGGGWYRAFSPSLANLAVVKRFDPERKPLAGAVVQAKVRLARIDGGLANVMVLFDLLDRARYRYVRLDPAGVKIGQTGRYGGVVAGVKKPFARAVLPDTWYTLKVFVYPNGLVKVKLNNVALGQYKFRSGVPGGVGLGAVRARSLADTYAVWGNAALP